jgi:hypothetical protein
MRHSQYYCFHRSEPVSPGRAGQGSTPLLLWYTPTTGRHMVGGAAARSGRRRLCARVNNAHTSIRTQFRTGGGGDGAAGSSHCDVFVCPPPPPDGGGSGGSEVHQSVSQWSSHCDVFVSTAPRSAPPPVRMNVQTACVSAAAATTSAAAASAILVSVCMDTVCTDTLRTHRRRPPRTAVHERAPAVRDLPPRPLNALSKLRETAASRRRRPRLSGSAAQAQGHGARCAPEARPGVQAWDAAGTDVNILFILFYII